MSTRDPGYDHDRDLRELPLGELMKRLSGDVQTLVHQELDLAKAELADKGKKAALGAGLFAGAAVVALAALGALTALLILLLHLVLAAWLAALIVTAFWLVVAGALAMAGRDRLAKTRGPVPQQTVETLKEDAQWVKTQMPSGKR